MPQELAFSDFENNLICCLNPARGRVRHAARNAIEHLQRSWRLADSDAEMACFRAISAEEEMSTAIITALQELQYPNAKKLNPRKHLHKLGIYPFLQIVRNFFASLESTPEVDLEIVDLHTKPWLDLAVKTPVGRIHSIPPLHFSFTATSTAPACYDFRHELAGMLAKRGSASLAEHLKPTVNLRNTLLYASHAGYHIVSGDVDETLQKMKQRVFVLLRALCLIFPHRTHGNFVQQVLDSYIQALKGIDESALEAGATVD